MNKEENQVDQVILDVINRFKDDAKSATEGMECAYKEVFLKKADEFLLAAVNLGQLGRRMDGDSSPDSECMLLAVQRLIDVYCDIEIDRALGPWPSQER